jgi:hypothetical protein
LSRGQWDERAASKRKRKTPLSARVAFAKITSHLRRRHWISDTTSAMLRSLILERVDLHEAEAAGYHLLKTCG